MLQVADHPERSRFELVEDGRLAFASYVLKDGILVIPHVEADPALRGTGAAGRLMEGIMAIALERGVKIRPVCGYAVAWMQRHPATSSLLA